jgi:putative colanic acid biosysnthesis UDP-glucose lipid carrier transferase
MLLTATAAEVIGVGSLNNASHKPATVCCFPHISSMLISSHSTHIARGRTSFVGLLRMTVDPALIVLSLLISCALTDNQFGGKELVLALIAFSLTFPGEVSIRRIRHGLLGDILVQWLLVVGQMVFFGYATAFIGYFDQHFVVAWLTLTPVLQYSAHRIIPLLAPQLLAIDGIRSAVIVSTNEIGRKLARDMRDEPTLGFRFKGFFADGVGQSPGVLDADSSVHTEVALLPDEGAVLGDVDAVASYVKAHGIEAVFIALPMNAQPRVLKLLDEMQDTTASIYFVPDIFIFDLIQARIDHINGIPVVAVCETPFVGINGIVKRSSDIVIAGLALLLLAPLMLAVAAGVKLGSPGPVIFRQRRYGVGGKDIVVYKFRSMTVADDGEQIKQAQIGDHRVTRFGAFIRRTSIDELPQLFNVLQGNMSMVGPRPHAVAHNEMYRGLIKGYMMRHKVKPGITGWAQVNGLRGETSTVDKMRERIEYDLDYLRRWSIAFDIQILLKTLKIVLRQTNAY